VRDLPEFTAKGRSVSAGNLPPGRLDPLESVPGKVNAVTRVVVDVMLKPEILDPQGQAVANALPRLGVTGINSVRIGKRIELDFDDEVDLDQVREIADKLLANPVIEDFTIRMEETAEVAK
jgi:phosphoribosylformylglycinamidine synthase subunit PurS